MRADQAEGNLRIAGADLQPLRGRGGPYRGRGSPQPACTAWATAAAQKTIGIIWMLLITSNQTAARDAMPPGRLIWSCYVAIGLDTLFGGGRVVKTMGQKITKLKHVGGFCAETGGAITLLSAKAWCGSAWYSK